MGVVLKRYLRNLQRISNLRINVRYLSFYNRRHSPLYSLVQNAGIRLVWNQHGIFCSQFSYFLSPNMEKIFFHIYGRPSSHPHATLRVFTGPKNQRRMEDNRHLYQVEYLERVDCKKASRSSLSSMMKSIVMYSRIPSLFNNDDQRRQTNDGCTCQGEFDSKTRVPVEAGTVVVREDSAL